MMTDRRVLLVEDVAAMRLYLRYALERYGVEVLEAEDLKTARQLLHTGSSPTSVLLDLELPDGNGLDLLQDLPRGIPVAALTGDDSRETARRCREAGCALVLSKSSKLGGISEILGKIERDWHPRPLLNRHEPALAERYLAYLADTLLELQQAARKCDLGAVRRIGHRLRGTAVHFGYGSIGASAGELGKAIASGNTRLIDVALDTLLERLAEVVGTAPTQRAQPVATGA
jgi:CheY-like chemotaxis protein